MSSKNKIIEKREEKWGKIVRALDGLKEGEFIKPTPLAKMSGVHKDTATDIMDGYDTLSEIGFINFRDKDRNWTGTIKSKESIGVLNLLREIRKEQLEQSNDIEDIKKKLKHFFGKN